MEVVVFFCAEEAQKTMRRQEHYYGEGVHLINGPSVNVLLGKFCTGPTSHHELASLMRRLYTNLLYEVVDHEFPSTEGSKSTRMITKTERGVFRGEFVAPTSTVLVNVLRAGAVPTQTALEVLMEFCPDQVRMDYLVVGRTTDETTHVVTGAAIMSAKIDEPTVEGQYFIMTDPMGATGGTTLMVLDHYYAHHGRPAKVLLVHLIVTPEYIRRVKAKYPAAVIYALRLDRGLSPDDVLAKPFGLDWDREVGLTEGGYIVPGAGDIGAVMNGTTI